MFKQKRNKIFMKPMAFFLICILFMALSNIDTYAYYNRGIVQLSLGTNSITVTKGSSSTIPVSMTPSYRYGNVGCGMAQCPQTCGGQCGDEVNGECGCAPGKETRYAAASLQNSNSMIADANYSQSAGVINIKGLNVGTTQVTVTGTLWQYTNSAPQTITVNVVEKSQGGTNFSGNGNSGSGGSTSSGSSTSSGNNTSSNNTAQTNVPSVGINGSTNTTSTENTTGEQESESESESSVIIDSKNDGGQIEMVTLGSQTKTGKDYFTSAMNEKRKVTFQKLDSSSNVEYSWTFDGAKITKPVDIDFDISFSDSAKILKSQTKDLVFPLYLTFAHHGALPAEATVTVNVQDKYKDGDKISLYYLNEDTGKIELVAKNLTVEAGYITFTIDHCSSYAISKGMTDSNVLSGENSGSHVAYIIIAIIIVLGLGTAGYYFIKKRKKKQA